MNYFQAFKYKEACLQTFYISFKPLTLNYEMRTVFMQTKQSRPENCLFLKSYIQSKSCFSKIKIYNTVISSQVLFHDGSLLHSKVQYTTVDYN
jgi:hypothetical protein